MNMDELPIWFIFIGTALLIVAAIEVGFAIGKPVRRKSEDEKESPVSAISGTVLALLAFMLAFTFSIVSDRYETRKDLVREQAAAISASSMQSTFLPEQNRDTAKGLYQQYIGIVLEASKTSNADKLPALLAQAHSIQDQLWSYAVDNVRAGDNSDIAAAYNDSVIEMSHTLSMRVAIAVQARIPEGVWVVLYALIILGMLAVGYQTAIAASKRTWSMLLLAFSFSIVITLIAALDDPDHGYLPVSQQPLIDVQTSLQQP